MAQADNRREAPWKRFRFLSCGRLLTGRTDRLDALFAIYRGQTTTGLDEHFQGDSAFLIAGLPLDAVLATLGPIAGLRQSAVRSFSGEPISKLKYHFFEPRRRRSLSGIFLWPRFLSSQFEPSVRLHTFLLTAQCGGLSANHGQK
jgi:hypothetical protein